MKKIDLFKCTEEISSMRESLEDNGLIGVSGGRVSVRNKLGELIETMNSKDDNKFIFLTYNHPDTELGYVWNSDKYTLDEAKSTVVYNYNKIGL